MPIRIYAFAKQLKTEPKMLLDICTQLGISGKGSALASLTDEEAAAIKAHLEHRTRPSRSPAMAGSGTAAPGADRAGPNLGAVRREDYVPPGGTAPRSMPDLGKKPLKASPPKKSSPEEETSKPVEKEKEKTAPAIKLAPIPVAQQPSATPKSDEPPPQKPELRLPADVIRASKAGAKPLSEHLRRHERLQQEKKKVAPAAKAAPTERKPQDESSAAASSAAGKDRDRPRRGRESAPVRIEEEEAGAALGGREHRQLKRKRAAVDKGGRREGGEEEEVVARVTPRAPRRLKRTGSCTAAPRKANVVVEFPCTVRSFSEALGIPAQKVLQELMKLGFPSIITSSMAPETAELVALNLGVEVDFRQPVSLEEKTLAEFEKLDDPADLQPRPPVVTFLGHVDHGKTSLLDRILGLDVAAHEKGGITQHIRAYRIEKDGRPIAFVDTPGHEAFTAMRARGANCTDIAVLVVAADDGVMPQTEEAISHARAAEVPIVVALNKIDLPGVNVDRTMQQLAVAQLLPSEWGGDTEVVRTSAVTGQGMDELLDTLLTVSELHEFTANPNRPATGICLEAEIQQGLGVVAKVLVQKGTLRVGDAIVCGSTHGRVKAMYDTLEKRRRVKQAGPSTPVNVTGLDSAPAAGDHFYAVGDVSRARQIAQDRAAASREKEWSGVRTRVTLENLHERLGEKGAKQTLNIILRADVRGSIEAIRKELTKLEHPEVQIKILMASVGGITEGDVHLADASDAVIIGFNVVPDENARALADRIGVQIRRYDIIYQVTDDLSAALEGMLKPEKRETDLGRALVLRTFRITRVGTVAGCRVLSGSVQRDGRCRVIRDSRIIGDYGIGSLKREKDDAREVREGFECGIRLAGFDDVKEGDVFEAYKIEEVRRTF